MFNGIKRLQSYLLLATLSLGLSACSEPKEEVDLLLVNGTVFTANADDTLQSVVAVKGDKIVAVGGNDLINKYSAAKSIDLKGRLLMPGFNDSHIHMRGRARHYVDLTKVTSIEEILTLVKKKADELGEGEWITGYGWSEDELAEKRRPLIGDLDKAVPNNPIVLTRAGAHSAVANSLALKLGGIDASTPDPDKGVIEKDENGQLNGIIRERQDLLLKLTPRGTDAELADSLEVSLDGLLSLGITSLTDAWTSGYGYKNMWQKVYDRSGDRLPRATVQINPGLGKLGYNKAIAAYEKFDGRTGDGNNQLKVGPIKIFVDGGFTGPAAWTIDGYKSDPTYFGKPAVEMEELYKLSKRAHDDGWQLGIHAIGDRAIVEAVDMLERVLAEAPRKDHRHYLNHFTVMPPAAAMDKMAKNNIAITQQPNFAYTLEGRYATYLGGERLKHNNPMRTPMNHGITVAMSSDVLPIGPLVGIYTAVTRKAMSGTQYGPEEIITIEEALKAYTTISAWVNHDDDIKGTLTAGMLADMIVLDQNLLTIDPEKIMDTKVDMTFVGGKLLYQAK